MSDHDEELFAIARQNRELQKRIKKLEADLKDAIWLRPGRGSVASRLTTLPPSAKRRTPDISPPNLGMGKNSSMGEIE